MKNTQLSIYVNCLVFVLMKVKRKKSVSKVTWGKQEYSLVVNFQAKNNMLNKKPQNICNDKIVR